MKDSVPMNIDANLKFKKFLIISYKEYHIAYFFAYLICLVFPWSELYSVEVFRIFVDFMGSFIRSITELSSKIPISSPERLKSELAFMHAFGLCSIAVSFFISGVYRARYHVSAARMLAGFFGLLYLIGGGMFFMIFWDGSISKPVYVGIFNSIIFMPLFILGIYYFIGILVSLLSSLVKYYFFKIYK